MFQPTLTLPRFPRGQCTFNSGWDEGLEITTWKGSKVTDQNDPKLSDRIQSPKVCGVSLDRTTWGHEPHQLYLPIYHFQLLISWYKPECGIFRINKWGAFSLVPYFYSSSTLLLPACCKSRIVEWVERIKMILRRHFFKNHPSSRWLCWLY